MKNHYDPTRQPPRDYEEREGREFLDEPGRDVCRATRDVAWCIAVLALVVGGVALVLQ